MDLKIRDPRARALASKLARLKSVSVTDAVVVALEAELQRTTGPRPLADRVSPLSADLKALAKPGGRDMTRAEIDAMWGQ